MHIRLPARINELKLQYLTAVLKTSNNMVLFYFLNRVPRGSSDIPRDPKSSLWSLKHEAFLFVELGQKKITILPKGPSASTGLNRLAKMTV